MRFGFLVAVAVVLVAKALPAYAVPVDCEPARCALQAALEQNCPCASATNHGRHVSCVARVVNKLAKDGVIPRNCKGKIRRCAARSVCGKPGFVTCQIPTDTCDPVLLTCTDNPTQTCTTNLDCGARCKIKRTAEKCTARGGTVGSSPTCCANCAP